TIEDRNNIPSEKIKIGMLCYVEDEGVLFQLKEFEGELSWVQFRAGGVETALTIEDRNNIPENLLYSGFTCFVIDEASTYIYMGEGQWAKSSTNAVFIGSEQPNDTSVLWIDDEDENVDASLDSDIITQVKETIKELTDKTNKVYYAMTKEIDPGYFNDLLPGESDENSLSNLSDEDGSIDLDNGAKGTVERILLKRGLKNDMEALHEGELAFCIDSEELYVGSKGYVKLLARVGGLGSSSNGSNNVTGEYVELVSPNGQKYRVRVNDDGDIICYNSIADTAESPTPDQSARYSGLIINHVYGGGAKGANVAPCSHGFIELYNKSQNTINLKGLSIQYGEMGKEWQVLPLKGIVKPMHSFLIRCAEHTDIHRKTTRFKIKNYDMHWDIPLSNNGMKVYLGIGDTPLTVKNPANIDNLWSKQYGYIDLLAYGSTNPAIGIDAYEKSGSEDGYLRIGNMLSSVHRKDFKDTDSSFMDLEAIDLKTADVKTYTPRCTKDGQWTSYYNKLKLYDHKPSMINIGFGQDGDTS
ncbi:MAG: hypothetical protein IJH34_02685, partial [Romboutsia sp.]|nr:hypothetical protein [Romboutsia sp.]